MLFSCSRLIPLLSLLVNQVLYHQDYHLVNQLLIQPVLLVSRVLNLHHFPLANLLLSQARCRLVNQPHFLLHNLLVFRLLFLLRSHRDVHQLNPLDILLHSRAVSHLIVQLHNHLRNRLHSRLVFLHLSLVCNPHLDLRVNHFLNQAAPLLLNHLLIHQDSQVHVLQLNHRRYPLDYPLESLPVAPPINLRLFRLVSL
jgi:hypothetical protein